MPEKEMIRRNDKLERENDTRTPLERISDEMRESLDAADAKKAGVGFDPSVTDALPLAMAYVPRQKWRNAYSPDEALSRGTMFAELDMPFYPPRVCGGCK